MGLWGSRDKLAACAALGLLSACAAATDIPIAPAAPDLVLPAQSSPKPTAPVVSEAAPTGRLLVNQHSVLSGRPLRATLVWETDVPQTVLLANDLGQALATTQTVPLGLDPQSGLHLHAIRFDTNGLSGRGLTVRHGETVSDPFDIGRSGYADLTRDSLNYFYQSRLGKAVEAAYVPARTPSLSRAAGHLDPTYPCFSGEDRRGTVWPGCDYALTLEGGWYDAGDYGHYAVNTGAAVWTLMNMAERHPKPTERQCGRILRDGTLPMPEAGNALPDILDEARHGMDYLMSTQIHSSAPQSVARGVQPGTGPLQLSQVDASGLVHHKVHGLSWPAEGTVASADTAPRRLYPPTTAATLHLAATGAQCARLFAAHDPAYAARCLAAARDAFDAAERLPDIYAWDEFEGGGPYDDMTLQDEFGWAATELWITTGEAGYAEAVERYIPAYDPWQAFNWQSSEARGLLSLTIAPDGDAALATRGRAALRQWADQLAGQASRSGFGIPYESADFYWGSNGTVVDHGLILASAHDVFGDRAHGEAAMAAMDYLLGHNALGRSYVTGYGERPMENPHHGFWRNGEDPTRPAPPPGVLSGGPNSVNFIDPVGSTLRGTCTGMTCWRDEAASYSMNEVAINWNASLAWMAHWMDRQGAVCARTPDVPPGADL